MGNVIVLLVLAVIIVFAVKGSIKHFKGEGACCGGGHGLEKTGRKTLDGPVVSEKLVKVTGMTCENCAERVKRAIDSVDGCAGEVDLKAGTAKVYCDRTTINDVDIKHAIENAGYAVDSIA